MKSALLIVRGIHATNTFQTHTDSKKPGELSENMKSVFLVITIVLIGAFLQRNLFVIIPHGQSAFAPCVQCFDGHGNPIGAPKIVQLTNPNLGCCPLKYSSKEHNTIDQ